MMSSMPIHEAMTKKAMMTLRQAVMALRHLQHADGHWCAVLEGDSILESEYLLMKFILGQEHASMADGRGAEVLMDNLVSIIQGDAGNDTSIRMPLEMEESSDDVQWWAGEVAAVISDSMPVIDRRHDEDGVTLSLIHI